MSHDDNGHSLRLAMLSSKTQEMMENFHDFLERKGKTRLDLKMGIAQFYHDEDLASQLSERISQDGADTGIASADLERLVEHFAVPQMVKRMGSADALSKIAAGTYNDKKRIDSWWLYNEAVFLRGLEGQVIKGKRVFGQVGVIDGASTGRGKTGLGIKLGEIALANPDYGFVTNVQMVGDIPESVASRVFIASRMSTLIRSVLALKREGKKVLVLLDEALFFFGRQDAMKDDIKRFDKFVRWIRKLGISLVLIVHDYETDIPEKFKAFVRNRFTKRTLKDLLVVVTADHFKFRRDITEVPDASLLPYDSESRGAFTMDLDILALSEYLTTQLEANPEADEDELTNRYLDNPHAAAQEDPFNRAPPRAPTVIERRVAEVLADSSAFVDEHGELSIDRMMARWGVNRQSAKAVSDIVVQKSALVVAKTRKTRP